MNQNNWVLTETQIGEIVSKIQGDFEKFPFKFPNNVTSVQGHFENGHFLHSNQYYFAKSYFESSSNCENLALLLSNKILELNLKETTLIGFRGYTGMLLNKVKSILQDTDWAIEFGVLEQADNKDFTWQFSPDKEKFKDNLVVVLSLIHI